MSAAAIEAVTGTQHVDRLELEGGGLTGASIWEGLLVWKGGSINGPETVTIGTEGILRLEGEENRDLSGLTLINQGEIVHTGNSQVRWVGGSRVENEVGGLIDLQGEVNWVRPNPATLVNRGTLRKSAGIGTRLLQVDSLLSEGQVVVWSGELRLDTQLLLSSTSTLEFGLSGMAGSGNAGTISSSRPIELDGALKVVLRDEFLPGVDQGIDLITSPVTGVFQTVSAPRVSPFVFLNPVYTANQLTLLAASPTPALTRIFRASDIPGIGLTVHGIADLDYSIWSSSDLSSWEPLATLKMPDSTVVDWIDVEAPFQRQRFYQVRYEP